MNLKILNLIKKTNEEIKWFFLNLVISKRFDFFEILNLFQKRTRKIFFF